MVADPLVGPLVVVVVAEAVEQQLQVLEIERRPFLGEPLLQGAVEALELAECLRVRGRGVDQLDACLAEPSLEGDLQPVQTAGEDESVVGEQLPRQPIASLRPRPRRAGNARGRRADRRPNLACPARV